MNYVFICREVIDEVNKPLELRAITSLINVDYRYHSFFDEYQRVRSSCYREGTFVRTTNRRRLIREISLYVKNDVTTFRGETKEEESIGKVVERSGQAANERRARLSCE